MSQRTSFESWAQWVPLGDAALCGDGVRGVVADRGVWGLLFSGLPAKLLCNGVSSVVFSVIWKTLMDRRRAAPGSPRKRDDGDGGNDDDDPEAGLLSRA